MRSHIIMAIIEREAKEMIRNPQSLVIMSIVVGINLLFSLSLSKPILVMTLVTSLVMIGFSLTSFSIVEEKDKNTLEALLVSPASFNEILFGKISLTFFITLVNIFVPILILHSSEISFLHSFISIPLCAGIICTFGLLVGLVCSSQAALSGIGTILMLTLFLPELLSSINENVAHLARALPIHHLVQLVSVNSETLILNIMKHYFALITFAIICFGTVRSFLKSAGTQENSKWKYTKNNKFWLICIFFSFITSSIAFNPIKGKIVKVDSNQSLYVNTEYKIKLPF
jgi:ABC-2 type transport system permease protein